MKSALVLTKFYNIPLVWKLWLLLLLVINFGGGITFVDYSAGKSAIVSLVGATIIMAIIYARLGFVRLLGLGRILFWLPMEVEFSLDLIEGNPQGLFCAWLLTVLVLNGISICLDFVDIVRYALGDTGPITQTAIASEKKK